MYLIGNLSKAKKVFHKVITPVLLFVATVLAVVIIISPEYNPKVVAAFIGNGVALFIILFVVEIIDVSHSSRWLEINKGQLVWYKRKDETDVPDIIIEKQDIQKITLRTRAWAIRNYIGNGLSPFYSLSITSGGVTRYFEIANYSMLLQSLSQNGYEVAEVRHWGLY